MISILRKKGSGIKPGTVHLHEQGLLDDLVFKGGTALRKLYAGNQGRFSLSTSTSA
jgi:hypothetical protein